MFGKEDELDKDIMHRIKKNQGCSIREAIRPFFLERSESVLRDRVRALELRHLIRLERTRKEVRCYPVGEVVE